MRSLRFLALGVAAASACGAFAQFGDDRGNPWTLRGGVLLVNDSTTKNTIAKSGVKAGVTYFLPIKGVFSDQGGNSGVDFDYSQLNGNGSRFEGYSLFYTERFPIFTKSGEIGGVGASYAYAGFGAGIVHQRGRNSIGDTFTKTGLGGQVMLGYQFNANWSIEASYRVATKLQGASNDGLGVTIGYRF